MKHPRQIDQALVDAYLARRALDYLVGFTLSPVLWRKLPGAKSAGRVQSVALRLVCDRELEIEKFVAREYWSLIATLATLMFSQDAATDTKKAADDTGHATKAAAKDTAHATKVAAKDTAKGTDKAAKKTAHGVKTVGKDVGKGVKKGADKTADAVK